LSRIGVTMKRKDIDHFEKTVAQLEALQAEITVLSKKSPNDGLNEFKLTLVNTVLGEANIILGKKYMPFPNFKAFNKDDVPSNSDVTFILAQYLNCMEKLRSDNIHDILGSDWYWDVDDGEDRIRTAPPKKIGGK